VPRLLLKIRKSRWEKTSLPAFLPKGDIPADCLTDLNIETNTLSVWYVEDDESNLNRVLTALAATRDSVSNFDYLLFNYTVVAALGLKISKTDGKTPDNVANRLWHRDLTELSGRSVLAFALAVFYNSDVKRIQERKILEWLKGAAANGEISSSILRPKLAGKVLTTSMPLPPRFLRMCRQVRSAIKDAWQEFRRA
jgi:hypothetical protein